MKPFPNPLPNRLLVVRAANRTGLALLDLAASLALQGPLRLLDGGNCISIYPLARALRRQTTLLEQTLRQVRLSRAFTCYQVLALLAETPGDGLPVLALDLLNTFYDESVPRHESSRLLQEVLRHLRRLRERGPLVISVRPPGAAAAERLSFYETITAAADDLY